ncbi:tetratricopeptide repeat protein [Myxococcota bacterium]|nr:tetratricopeptide repeat protein [Myxococcota bacterium]
MVCADRRFVRLRPLTRGLLCLALLSCAGALTACQDDATRLAEHLARAEKQLEGGQPNEAIIEYKNALQIAPNDAEAHFGLAKAYLATRDVGKAYWELQETVRIDPENLDARLAFAQFLLLGSEDEFTQALEQTAAILEREPDKWEAYLLRARALENLKRIDEAQADYEKAVELVPDNADVLRTLAAFLARKGDHAAAESLFRKLVEMDPSAQSWFQLAGFLSLDRDRDAAALAAFRTGLELAEGDALVDAYQRLASFYYQRERYDESEKTLQEGIDASDRNIEMIYALARFYHSRGDPQRADQMIEEATEARPDEVAPLLILSAYRGRNGDIDGALEAAERALALDPAHVPARLRKAELLIDRGVKQGERELLVQGRAIVAEVLAEDAGSAEGNFVAAKLDLAEGKPAEAVVALRRALDTRGDWAQAHFLLATALLVQGERQQARAEALRAIQIDAEFLEARRLLARIHAALGENDLAIEEARRILRQRPGDRDIRVLLAQNLVNQGKAEEARVELEAIPLSERSAEVHFALGRIAMLQGKADIAREKLLAALDERPNHAEILESMLRLDAATGRIGESLERLRKAQQAEPDDSALVRLEGIALVVAGEGSQAETRLRHAIEMNPNDLAAYQALARYLLGSGRRAESVTTYEQAVASRPDSAPLHFTLGTLYEAENRREDAITQYEEAIRIDSTLAVAKNNLAYLLAEQGDQLDRALELAQQAKAEMPDSPNAADTLGWVLLKKGIPEAAIGYLKEAEGSFPPDHGDLGWIRYHLAMAYEASGQPEQARAVLEKAFAGFEEQKATARARGFEGEIPDPSWVKDARVLLDRLPAGAAPPPA